MHWTEPYLGIPYGREADCAALVERVLRERYGVAVVLPSERRWEDVSPEDVSRLAGDQGVEVETPRDGDMLLMRTRGAVRAGCAHVGVYTEIAGRRWVLHSTSGAGSHLTPVAEIASEGLEPMGYYRAS